MTIQEQRELLKRYAKKIEDAGYFAEFLDYELSLIARKNECGPDVKAIWVCQMFRPERDGYSGYKLIEESVLDEWLND